MFRIGVQNKRMSGKETPSVAGASSALVSQSRLQPQVFVPGHTPAAMWAKVTACRHAAPAGPDRILSVSAANMPPCGNKPGLFQLLFYFLDNMIFMLYLFRK